MAGGNCGADPTPGERFQGARHCGRTGHSPRPEPFDSHRRSCPSRCLRGPKCSGRGLEPRPSSSPVGAAPPPRGDVRLARGRGSRAGGALPRATLLPQEGPKASVGAASAATPGASPGEPSPGGRPSAGLGAWPVGDLEVVPSRLKPLPPGLPGNEATASLPRSWKLCFPRPATVQRTAPSRTFRFPPPVIPLAPPASLKTFGTGLQTQSRVWPFPR